jgi:hypothetical protein
VEDDYAYVAYADSGLLIIDVSDPSNPVEVGSYDTQGYAVSIDISGTYAYIADHVSGFHIVDISDPENPFRVGPGGRNVLEYVEVEGNYAYLLTDPSFFIVDISDPINPITVAVAAAFNSQFVHVQGRYAYMGGAYMGGGGFRVLDVSDPSDPTIVGVFSIPAGVNNACYSRGYAYLACYRSFTILRVIQQGGCDYSVGDVNDDGVFNGLDIVYGVSYLKGGNEPPYFCDCPPHGGWFVAGDVNGSCSYNGLDITYGVAYFKGGPGPIPCADCPPVE